MVRSQAHGEFTWAERCQIPTLVHTRYLHTLPWLLILVNRKFSAAARTHKGGAGTAKHLPSLRRHSRGRGGGPADMDEAGTLRKHWQELDPSQALRTVVYMLVGTCASLNRC